MLTVGVTGAQAKGGTAKPPAKGLVATVPQASLPDPPFSADVATLHGFDVTGFIQDAKVDPALCPNTPADHAGGTVTLNNVTITVPCNLIVQMPANTLTWPDFVNGIGPTLPTTLKGGAVPSFELQVIGNSVNGKRIAGLAYASQQSLNAGSGFVTGFDFANGSMTVDDGTGAPTIVQINDPKIGTTNRGRFSAGQSPDPRFSVDQANPTIHAGTGFPMCIPAAGDNASGVGGADPLCPQQNRPKPAGNARHCPNFTDVATLPPTSGEITQPAAGQVFCSQFVMPAPPQDLTTPTPGLDARQQVPFEVGDYVDYAGTLVHPASGPDFVSAHTIEANVGVYTKPGSKPSYLAIGEFGIGTADPNATAVNGAAQETQDRLFLEAETTDVNSPMDIYITDTDPTTGAVRNRWITPFEMTGENQAGNPSGGITTQFAGPQPQRARVRATKAPTGLLGDPSRTIRVANRVTCTPSNPSAAVSPAGVVPAPGGVGTVDDCLNNPAGQPLGVAANGLATGQYTAPVFSFIFPENVRPGDSLVPYDLWHLGFLRFGEGPANPIGPPTGPLTPAPW
jgi:hypothetical protein